MSENEPLSKVLIGINCFKLISSDLLSKSDPQVLVKEYSKSKEWVEIHRTEKIMNNLNPSFSEFEKYYFFEQPQKLRFELYDINEHKKCSAIEKGDFLGQFTASLAQLARVGKTSGRLKDFEGKDLKSGSIEVLNLILIFFKINVREVQNYRDQLELSFSASNLPRKGKFVKEDPSTCLTIESITHSKRWNVVYTTKTVKDSRNPVYKALAIKLFKLTINEGQFDDKIRISICKAKKHSSVYGSVAISISELVDAANSNTQKSWDVSHDSGNFKINLTRCRMNQCSTFVDYIQNGLELNLAVAIDFTGSNGDPRHSDSLHYLSDYGNYLQNDYTQAIEAVGRVIEDYDTDKMFPVLGFGAKLGPNFSHLSHDFAVNMNPDSPECFGIDGILQAYRNCIPNVKLYGPTNFEPVIRRIINLASNSQIYARYYVLLILTDGVITDLKETVEAVITASELPISIIIIGVGNADFDEMNFLDSDDRVLKSADGRRQSKRDIVQFVPFNDYRSKSSDMLAKQVLAELPEQVVNFYNTHGLPLRNS